MKPRTRQAILFIFLLACTFMTACQNSVPERSVVVYTSVDQVYAEPILTRFEEESGIRVLPVYDVEAAKTTGLVNRLIAEKDRPQADVFWSGEFAQTILLKEEEVLQPYASPNAADIPAAYIDPDGYWTGFAGRARVLIVNSDRLSPQEYPHSIYDLLDPDRLSSDIGMAYPLFGTTSTHAAALYASLGSEEGRAFFEAVQARGVRIVDGNSVVRDMVANGQLAFGLTDTDDACGAITKGDPVVAIFPDQEDDALGTLVIPNTVALIAGAPHPQEGKEIIDFLLNKDVAEALVTSGWSHVPLRPVGVQPDCFETASIRGMSVNLNDVYAQLPRVKTELAEIFIR